MQIQESWPFYAIDSRKAKHTIIHRAPSLQDAITWAQNNCDLSQEPWTVTLMPNK